MPAVPVTAAVSTVGAGSGLCVQPSGSDLACQGCGLRSFPSSHPHPPLAPLHFHAESFFQPRTQLFWFLTHPKGTYITLIIPCYAQFP